MNEATYVGDTADKQRQSSKVAHVAGMESEFQFLRMHIRLREHFRQPTTSGTFAYCLPCVPSLRTHPASVWVMPSNELLLEIAKWESRWVVGHKTDMRSRLPCRRLDA